MGDHFETLKVGDEVYEIRYPIDAFIRLKKEGGKILGISRNLNINEIINGLDTADPEYLMFALWQGLLDKHPTLKQKDANKIFNDHMADGDLDAGGKDGKLETFKALLGSAMNMGFNVDLKKARERVEEEKKKAEEEKTGSKTLDESA